MAAPSAGSVGTTVSRTTRRGSAARRRRTTARARIAISVSAKAPAAAARAEAVPRRATWATPKKTAKTSARSARRAEGRTWPSQMARSRARATLGTSWLMGARVAARGRRSNPFDERASAPGGLQLHVTVPGPGPSTQVPPGQSFAPQLLQLTIPLRTVPHGSAMQLLDVPPPSTGLTTQTCAGGVQSV